MSKSITSKFCVDREEERDVSEDQETLAAKSLYCAVFFRAWNDLSLTPEVKKEDRRSAVMWFLGLREDDSPVTVRECYSIIKFTQEQQELINMRVAKAERYLRNENKEQKAA